MEEQDDGQGQAQQCAPRLALEYLDSTSSERSTPARGDRDEEVEVDLPFNSPPEVANLAEQLQQGLDLESNPAAGTSGIHPLPLTLKIEGWRMSVSANTAFWAKACFPDSWQKHRCSMKYTRRPSGLIAR